MKVKTIIASLLCLVLVMTMQLSALASDNPTGSHDQGSIPVIIIKESEVEKNLRNSVLLDTVDLGNGLKCSIYERQEVASFSANVISKTFTFSLTCGGNYLGYLDQTTSWSYDGVNRPVCLSNSNTFHSTDPSKNYLINKGSTTTHYGSSSSKYTMLADVYYNTKYTATSEFSAICDKNGNPTPVCTDV